MDNLQKAGGGAAIVKAIIYISAFVFFGGFWNYPVDAGAAEELSYLSENQSILSIAYITMYVLFGVLLAVLVLALHERLKKNAASLSQVAAIFGVVWVGLVIASGMIANIGLASVLELAHTAPEQAITIWRTIGYVVEGIGGGNEMVGGLWVLLLSIAALKANQLPKLLNYIGIFVGSAGILTVYPADLLTAIFGLSQIVWFFWLGVAMLRNV